MAITKVWIEPGCIMCELSVDTCSAVFEISEEAGSACVRADADFTKYEADIMVAADNCPVSVIKYEEG